MQGGATAASQRNGGFHLDRPVTLPVRAVKQPIFLISAPIVDPRSLPQVRPAAATFTALSPYDLASGYRFALSRPGSSPAPCARRALWMIAPVPDLDALDDGAGMRLDGWDLVISSGVNDRAARFARVPCAHVCNGIGTSSASRPACRTIPISATQTRGQAPRFSVRHPSRYGTGAATGQVPHTNVLMLKPAVLEVV